MISAQLISLIEKFNPRLKLLFFFNISLIFIGVLFEVSSVGILLPIINFISKNDSNQILDLFIFKFDVSYYSKYSIVFYYFLVILFFYCFKFVFFYFLNFKQSLFISNLSQSASKFFYKKYLYEDFETHIEKNPNKLIFNIQTEVSLFVDIVKSVLYLYSEITVVISMFFLLIFVQPIGTILITALLFGIVYLYSTYQKKITQNLGIDKQKFDNIRYKYLTEGINGFKEIIIHNSRTFFIKNYELNNDKFTNATSRFYFISQISKTFLEFTAILALVLLVFILLFLRTDLDQIVSILGIFLLVAFRLLPSGARIIASIQALRYGKPTINLIISEVKNLDSFNHFSEQTLEYNYIFKTIEINKLTFKYSTSPNFILNNVSLVIQKGETIGVVGKSGSGKSTFVNILLCLIKPYSGDISCNGKSIFYNSTSWRSNIGYVPQSIYLLDDSIKNNIAFGIEEDQINLNKLINSIKLAQLEDYVTELKDGINTLVGDRGVKISGGQRQRIGIARALYLDPEILIFDEATSALDAKTEKDFMNTIYSLQNKTKIIITHRPSTLLNSNRVFELKNGNLNKIDLNV
jgi:ABC-type multidrug transport system fused ATPase/permease subunit